jgi:hypothetical protein
MIGRYINKCCADILGTVIGKILAYRVLQNAGLKKTDEFVRKLCGRETTTHKGRYHYRTRGLLDEIPHRRLIRGVVIIRPEDEERLVEFLERYGAEYFTRDVILTPEDREILGRKPPAS